MEEEYLDLIIERAEKVYDFYKFTGVIPVDKKEELMKFFDDLYQVPNQNINIQNRDIDETDKKIVYRGIHDINISDYVKILKQDNFNLYRFGVIGYGTYFASNYSYALSYAKNNETNVLKAKINNDAKFIEYDDVKDEIIDFFDKLEYSEHYSNLDGKFKYWLNLFIMNNRQYFSSIFSSLLGYDGIKAYDTERKEYNICVTNPKAVDIIYKDNSKC